MAVAAKKNVAFIPAQSIYASNVRVEL